MGSSFIVVFLLGSLLCLVVSQHHLRTRVGPWRQRLQWENNGHVYSLLSTGTRYRLPAQSRARPQVLLTTRNGFNQHHAPAELRGAIQTRSGGSVDATAGDAHPNAERHPDASVLGADARQYVLVRGQPRRIIAVPLSLPNSGQPVFVTVGRQSQQVRHNVSAAPAAFSTVHEFSGSGVPRGGRSTPGEGAGTGPNAAPAVPSPNFTHSRGGRIRSIPGTFGSISRSPTTAGMAGPWDRENARRPQRTGPGDSRTGARFQTRTALEPNVSPTALPTNTVEMSFSRHGQDASQSTETSDPRDPHSIHHRNSVFYNLYPPDHRNRGTSGHGQGTGFFDNGEMGGGN